MNSSLPGQALSTALMDRAADLLVHIAGDADWHVAMPGNDRHNYARVPRPLTRADARAHLDGHRACGASLGHTDGSTWALAWEADHRAEWQVLQDAAGHLVRAGAKPLLVQAPGEDGGRLWLIFDRAVWLAWARSTVYGHTPALAAPAAHWPAADPTRAIRLPGGYYRSAVGGPPTAGWCRVAQVPPDGPPIYTQGRAVAPLLLGAQTPATWVSPAYGSATAPGFAAVTNPTVAPNGLVMPADLRAKTTSPRALPAAALDPHWVRTLGADQLTRNFWFTPSEVAAYYNARHSAWNLLPPTANGYGRATWRDDPSASIVYHPDGIWSDEGAEGRRPDGTHDGGDVVELYCQLYKRSRAAVLTKIAREMVAKSQQELEYAAACGRPPAAWVAAITSPSGWYYYDALRQR